MALLPFGINVYAALNLDPRSMQQAQAFREAITVPTLELMLPVPHLTVLRPTRTLPWRRLPKLRPTLAKYRDLAITAAGTEILESENGNGSFLCLAIQESDRLICLRHDLRRLVGSSQDGHVFHVTLARFACRRDALLAQRDLLDQLLCHLGLKADGGFISIACINQWIIRL